jgi:hypothetical protein
VSGCPAVIGTTAISRMASPSWSWAPLPSRSRATRGALVHEPVLLLMALAPSGSVLLVVCIPRLSDELVPGARETVAHPAASHSHKD